MKFRVDGIVWFNISGLRFVELDRENNSQRRTGSSKVATSRTSFDFFSRPLFRADSHWPIDRYLRTQAPASCRDRSVHRHFTTVQPVILDRQGTMSCAKQFWGNRNRMTSSGKLIIGVEVAHMSTIFWQSMSSKVHLEGIEPDHDF